MKHDIIKTDNYLLVVNDSEIKEGDWVSCTGGIRFVTNLNDYKTDNTFVDDGSVSGQKESSYCHIKNYKKVIAHLPLNNSPVLDGVDLLPLLEQEDDVEKMVKGYFEKDKELNNPSSFKAGYNKARERYCFTEEDVRKAISMVKKNWTDEVTNEEKIIQSLSQPKMPIEFECEMEKDYRYNDDGEPIGFKVHDSDKIKTTTNSQGQTVWVGRYIYL